MQWVIFIIVLINLFLTLGLVGAVAELSPRKKNPLSASALDDYKMDFEEGKGKKAVKQTTTLKKRGNVAKSQKRAGNGRFA